MIQNVSHKFLHLSKGVLLFGILFLFAGKNAFTKSHSSSGSESSIQDCHFEIYVNAFICQNEYYYFSQGDSACTPGVYYDTVIVSLGCDSVFITTLQKLTVSTQTFSVSICAGETYLLPSGQTTKKPGIYSDTLKSEYGCDSLIVTTILSITLNPIQYVSASLCAGTSYQLPSGNTTTSAGIYIDTIQNTQGCYTIIKTDLSIVPQLAYTLKSKNISCYGRADGQLEFSVSAGTPPFNFQLSGINSNASGTFTALSAGEYSYSITDMNGCTISGKHKLLEPEKIILSATPALSTIDLGNSVNYTLTCNYTDATFFWSPVTFLTCDTCQQNESTPDSNITYTITAKIEQDNQICSAEIPVTILINPKLYIPSAFTPNGDGLNDFFQMRGNNFENLRDFCLKIFDRWGELIFESTDSSLNWDGKFNGSLLPDGEYVYTITQEKILLKSGSVILLK